MRQLLLLSLMAVTLAGYSQEKVVDLGKQSLTTNYNAFGTSIPASNTKYIRLVEGTPYFRDEWMDGKLILSDDKVCDSMRIKLDLTDNSLLYLDKGKEMMATSVVKEVDLVDPATGQAYQFIHSSFLSLPENMKPGWYQFMGTGKTIIYKQMVKNIAESKPYGSATTEQKISTSDQYFLYHNSTFTRVKKLKEVPDLLINKRNELAAFISSRKLSGKSDTDYAELMAYYNQLVP